MLLSGANPALPNTGAIAAAEYNGLPVLGLGPCRYLRQLDGGSVMVLHLDRWLVLAFKFRSCFHAYRRPSSFFPKGAKSVFFFAFFCVVRTGPNLLGVL